MQGLFTDHSSATTILFLISNNNETSYRCELLCLTEWFNANNNLDLNGSKSQELVVIRAVGTTTNSLE